MVTGHLDPSAEGQLAGKFQTLIRIRPAETEHGKARVVALFFYAHTGEDPVYCLSGVLPD